MILAVVTLFQCDECRQIICLRDDAEWISFARDWHGGFEFQFCPECRRKPETLIRQAKDRWLGEDAKKAVMEAIN